MECKHAYIDKKIDYVLCDLEPKPNPFNRKEMFHAVCAHQVHCPKAKCHKLSASWRKCTKLVQKPQDVPELPFTGGIPVPVPGEPHIKRSRKATAADSEE